ncbi:MAG TPA: alpha-ketoglutarate-dependent dioxygenase AlkB [Chitinophagales bacterium]|nr:alpha-ketoglutarate-dependent dioxygenase AlkB [Chitinophagales bacterium]HRK26827.1 alpha-ketoglutarate-dependent dioxygenase AlkB [Chitinophagales bacterium]
MITPTHHLQLPDADLLYVEHFIDQQQATQLFTHLANPHHIKWRQDTITLFGKPVLTPRLSAWYGIQGAVYTYSGLTLHPHPLTPTLLNIKQQIEQFAPHTQFNSVLLNFYRNGADSMGWHADDEPELGKNPVIASVNLGATRRFLLRHTKNKHIKHEIALHHGSLLLMQGTTQHYWQHAIPKTAKPTNARINLTFRYILPIKNK